MISKHAKKAGISKEYAEKIILKHHSLKNFYTKKQLTSLKLDLDIPSWKLLNKIAKALKVDIDSVLGAALDDYLRSV